MKVGNVIITRNETEVKWPVMVTAKLQELSENAENPFSIVMPVLTMYRWANGEDIDEEKLNAMWEIFKNEVKKIRVRAKI